MKNTRLSFLPRRLLPLAFVLVTGLLILSGCMDTPRIFWSPDGSRAMIVNRDGLYLCDKDGKLSSLLLPDVRTAVWLPDSAHVVCAVEHKTEDWGKISSLLSREEQDALQQKAQALLARLDAGAAWHEETKEMDEEDANFLFFLRIEKTDRLRSKLSEKEWTELAGFKASWHELLLVSLQDATPKIESLISKSVYGFQNLRTSPDGAAIAYTADTRMKKELWNLWVSLLENSKPVLVSDRSARHSDWTPDSRSLVFELAAGKENGGADTVMLGSIVSREVRAADGSLKLSETTQELAGLLHNGSTRVRCLRDGRIIFNAAEIRLPLSAADMREMKSQLYALDLHRSSTLTHLVPLPQLASMPENLEFFEVSPDETKVFFAAKDAAVSVLVLGTGEVKEIQKSSEGAYEGFPAWRTPDELTYFKVHSKDKTKKAARPVEVILRRGKQEIVLSRDWSDEFLKSLTKSE